MGWWVSLRGRQAEPVIGGGGKATLAGGHAAVPGLPTGLAARRLPARFYGHRVSSCSGARLRSAPRSQSGRGKAVNNQPRSILATSPAGSPAVPGPPCSPPGDLGACSAAALLPAASLGAPPSATASVLGAETRAPNTGGGRGPGWGSVFPPPTTKLHAGVWLLGV